MTTIRMEMELLRLLQHQYIGFADVVADLNGKVFSVIGTTFILGDTWLLLSGREIQARHVQNFLRELKETPVSKVFIRKGGYCYHISNVVYRNNTMILETKKQ